MNPTSSPQVVSLSERRAAKRDPVTFAGLADALAKAVVTDRGLTAFQPGNAINEFARWYADADDELLVAVVAPTEPATTVGEVLALGLAWRQDRDLLLVLSPEHCSLLPPRRPWAGPRVRVWEYDDTLVPRPAPDPFRAEDLETLPEGQPIRPGEVSWLSHQLRDDWLKLLLSRPEAADLNEDEQRTGPRDMARGLHVAGRPGPTEIHGPSISNLEQLAPQLIDELERITLPFSDHAPSDAELRIAQNQLEGWLEELSQRLQTEFFAVQMAAQQQLLRMGRDHGSRRQAADADQDRGLDQCPGPGTSAPDRIGQSYQKS